MSEPGAYARPPEGSRCQEAAPSSHTTYVPCGLPASYVVKNSDPHPYAMCASCADHNVRNRGARRVMEGEAYQLAVVPPPADDLPDPPTQAGRWTPTTAELLDWGLRGAAALKAKLEQGLVPLVERTTAASELAQLYSALRRISDAMNDATNVMTAQYQRLGQERIPDAFEREKISSFTTRDGYRVTVSVALRTAIRADQKVDAYSWLREHGLGDLIVEQVNAGTLSAAGRTFADEGRELPEELFNCYYQNTTSVTRIRRK